MVGGGNAALCAAISARRERASVLVLEAAPKFYRGGNTRHTRIDAYSLLRVVERRGPHEARSNRFDPRELNDLCPPFGVLDDVPFSIGG